MKFKLIKRGNQRDISVPKKLYAIPVGNGKITENNPAKDIFAQSSLIRGDAGNVIANLLFLKNLKQDLIK
ncbi:MAG: hypothetical protein LBT50_00350 [Prevotellaceae bacterium]|jgi:hypothetical protein|nr:hypothetical protein [Prevotellaceae bacterium]